LAICVVNLAVDVGFSALGLAGVGRFRGAEFDVGLSYGSARVLFRNESSHAVALHDLDTGRRGDSIYPRPLSLLPNQSTEPSNSPLIALLFLRQVAYLNYSLASSDSQQRRTIVFDRRRPRNCLVTITFRDAGVSTSACQPASHLDLSISN
jgi:hypothetical protein